MKTIVLVPGDPYRLAHYGVALVSKTTHAFTGPGYIHNRSFQHSLDVWLNSNGTDPKGNWTDDDLSYLFSAQPSVISAHVDPSTPERGETLEIGETILLTTGNREIGKFKIVSGNLSDPHLERISS